MPIPTKPIKFPDWATDAQTNPVSGQTNYVEPPSDKKTYGWEYNEIPPRQYFNWWQRVVGLWVRWIEPFVELLRTDLDTVTENLSANDDNTLNSKRAIASVMARNGFQEQSSAAHDFRHVIYAEEVYIALAVAYGSGVILINGSSPYWAAASLSATSNWTEVCWSPELSLFAVISASGICNTSPSTASTWTARTMPAALSWTSIAWSKTLNLFAVVANGEGTQDVVTSPDGIVWTRRNCIAGTWSKVVWAESIGVFVAVANSGSKAMTSTDGITWTSRTMPRTSYNSVTWSEYLGIFVAVGDGGVSAISSNGYVWENGGTVGLGGKTKDICWAKELNAFVAIGEAVENVVNSYSFDGSKWFVGDISTANFNSVVWSSALCMFYRVSGTAGSRIVISL